MNAELNDDIFPLPLLHEMAARKALPTEDKIDWFGGLCEQLADATARMERDKLKRGYMPTTNMQATQAKLNKELTEVLRYWPQRRGTVKFPILVIGSKPPVWGEMKLKDAIARYDDIEFEARRQYTEVSGDRAMYRDMAARTEAYMEQRKILYAFIKQCAEFGWVSTEPLPADAPIEWETYRAIRREMEKQGTIFINEPF